MAIVGFLAKLFVAAVLLSAALASAKLYGVMHPLTLGLVAVGIIAGNHEQWQVTHRWLAWLFVAIFAVESAMVAGHGILTRVRVKVEY